MHRIHSELMCPTCKDLYVYKADNHYPRQQAVFEREALAHMMQCEKEIFQG